MNVTPPEKNFGEHYLAKDRRIETYQNTVFLLSTDRTNAGKIFTQTKNPAIHTDGWAFESNVECVFELSRDDTHSCSNVRQRLYGSSFNFSYGITLVDGVHGT